MFWGMLEMGVAMVAICLPALRPLLKGTSLESIMRSFRSILSLGSTASKSKSYRPSKEADHARGESETNFANTDAWGIVAHANQHQTFAMGPVASQAQAEGSIPNGEVWVDKNLAQTVETV